jgi:GR25 family glycosyltransferase involved in LPS biosynthesis
MLNGIDIVYWINLDRSNDRRYNMTTMFEDDAFKDIKNERFPAIDYKTNDIMDKFHLDKANYKNELPEYACFLSHLETIRQFANSDLPDNSVALIMEDDATLEYKQFWKTSIKNVINNAPTDWEIIMLNYMFKEGSNWPDLSKTADYEKNTSNFFSALSYLIKKSTAKKLTDKMYENGKYNIDLSIKSHHADEYLFTALNTYTYKYPFFTYKTENDSYLHPNHLDNHKKSKLYIMKSLYGTEGFSNVDSDGQFIKKDMFISILLLFVFAFLIGVIFYFVANRHTRLYSKIFGRIMKFKTT